MLDLSAITKRHSCFLFGPRQTGKSWLISHTLRHATVYDLLDNDIYLRLSHNPKLIEQEAEASGFRKLIVIDEVQRLPELLNEVHRLIETRRLRFVLTGSSARKLRRGGVNLLGGRARVMHLHSFVRAELGKRFDLYRAVNYGLLPPILFSDSPDEDLKAYVGTYLREEIAAEAVARNVPAFSRFLQVAAFCNATMINYSRISNDAQVARTTVMEYFQILKDTMVAFELPAWKRSVKRKPISTSKCYFFDPGVVRFLQDRRSVEPRTPEYGQAVETYIFHELRSYADYHGVVNLNYWRSLSGFEVDFIMDDTVAIEIKATGQLSEADLKGLRALREEGNIKRFICVTMESHPRVIDGIRILPLELFLDELWAGGIVTPRTVLNSSLQTI
jgi:predicted AAA+ superfamily ATPase